ncbi:PucR family transcriptional regulator [Sphaerisporangium album]|uniref:PucR family transcriptional regulator n=1 Tax=Sphaerisporangium album TaxID=509200 RepID=A0A367FLN1_9ACTN|nr:helix-turn-helix domain-containing protein [Sphaerisporangium album]RCG30627.1 PucR family transcriptional regulator [Sphaerisporangium album]
MKRAGRPSEQLTVDELVRYGPLGHAEMLVGENLARPVSRVALISDLDQVRHCGPGTAVVLSRGLALGAWAVESALRLAWERSAACLVSPAVVGLDQATAQLARRMRLPVFVVTGDTAACALDLAAAIASPEAARARLAARCAELFAERSNARGIVGVINSEVPGVTAALVAPDGHVLAGQASVDRAEHRVQVDVPGPDGRRWAELVAATAGPSSPTWAETVLLILRLARGPLAASVARERLEAVHGAERGRAALRALFAPPDPGPAAQAEPAGRDRGDEGRAVLEEALGWRVDGRHVAVFLRSGTPLDTAATGPGVISAWQEVIDDLPLVPWETGWASWWTGEEIEVEQVASALRRHLARMRSPIPLSAGVGRVAEGPEGLRESLSQAMLAAGVTVRDGPGTVRSFDELGFRVLLASLSQPELVGSARMVLADLLSAPDGPVLVATLAALLDCANSTSQAAARLGVHRNTVLGRLERIRARGVDPDRPDQRLALHLACYALLPEVS